MRAVVGTAPPPFSNSGSQARAAALDVGGFGVRTSPLDGVGSVWEIPSMIKTLTTKIDDRYRPGALNGLVEKGETYQVDRISPDELRFRRMVVSERAPAWIVREGDLLVLASDRVFTQEEADKAKEDYL